MNTFNVVNESGYSVKDLSTHLKELIKLGMGDRKIMVGPVDGDDGRVPIAQPVIGIEANAEDNESDICWLYPGANSWE